MKPTLTNYIRLQKKRGEIMLALYFGPDHRETEKIRYCSTYKLEDTTITAKTPSNSSILFPNYRSKERTKEVFDEIVTAIKNREPLYVVPAE